MSRYTQVIIETPKGSRQKFDYEPESGSFLLSKLMPAGTVFPFDFGFIPGTIGDDGDPFDVMLISELNTFTGCVVDCRIIGGIKAQQREKDGKITRNDRFIAVPEISLAYEKLNSLKEIPEKLLKEIEQFFIGYNLQAGKSFKVQGHINQDQALKLIDKGRRNNHDKQKLIQLFLPLTNSRSADQKLKALEQKLIKNFGGLSIYAQNPVLGSWREKGQLEKDKMMVFEVMVPLVDQKFWKKLKTSLEKQFRQKEILIRSLDIGMI
ncbi:inorganic diphosphatase [Pedobacter sp. KBS0701]|uniref:inorganic diphosphatase n=1 Tax=Pedobacter sp. KBS0701 TaxID=2578106 RepID=UPI00110E9F01|nr:inorganic diphosphatase [Pedobacter sp. KBS0701]QDW26287.1 inorganic diphosphatase [Pedobacter sp. KBS0701]